MVTIIILSSPQPRKLPLSNTDCALHRLVQVEVQVYTDCDKRGVTFLRAHCTVYWFVIRLLASQTRLLPSFVKYQNIDYRRRCTYYPIYYLYRSQLTTYLCTFLRRPKQFFIQGSRQVSFLAICRQCPSGLASGKLLQQRSSPVTDHVPSLLYRHKSRSTQNYNQRAN